MPRRYCSCSTGGCPRTREGTTIFHELVRVTFEDTDPLAALPDILAHVHPGHRGRYATALAPDWHPDQATEFNGAVWPCLGSAVWALRTTASFEDAIRAAIDLGGDTDTVAAVTGGLAGAYYGLHAIPARWTQPLHVPSQDSTDGCCTWQICSTLHTASEAEPGAAPHSSRTTALSRSHLTSGSARRTTRSAST